LHDRSARRAPRALLLAPILIACACTRVQPPQPAPAAQVAQHAGARRAIVVSFDALNEARVRESLPRAAVPNFLALFEGGACAAHAVSAFPSVTAPSHAVLWTGAYGDVTGVTANRQPRLPRDRHTLLDGVSGFSAEVLGAEPLWITAARAGRTVMGHHVTQAPQPPGYPPASSRDEAEMRVRREAAARVLQGPGIFVVNGHNREIAGHAVLTERTHPLRPAGAWAGLEKASAGRVPSLETAWVVGKDSVFALFHGDSVYTQVRVALTRDATAGVVAAAAPADTSDPRGRALARHFSEPLELEVDGGRAYLVVRLFELAPDGSRYLLYHPGLNVIEANRPEVAAAYDAAVRGWVAGGADAQFAAGEFGAPAWQGGDGTAEARLLETYEYLTRQYMRGSEWAWNELRVDLLLDYFPLADGVDHRFYGYVAREWTRYDDAVARKVQELRRRAWALVDLRLEHLRRLAAGTPDAALFVAGDHGMRATWRVFRPNAALRDAGLLVLDGRGQADLTRTRALSPNGYWVSINRTAWRGGIVPPEDEARVLAAAEAALLAVRDPAGRPVVTRIYRPDEHPELGLGGPAGGDLYFATAPGVRWSPDPSGPAISDGRIDAGHGFPSEDPDMWTAFCAEGAGFTPRRIGAVRTTAVAPTVAEWLGIPAPADAVGRSVLGELLGR
jgi:predicted AlkP superfamily phosphohydrolase/phosphomutase